LCLIDFGKYSAEMQWGGKSYKIQGSRLG